MNNLKVKKNTFQYMIACQDLALVSEEHTLQRYSIPATLSAYRGRKPLGFKFVADQIGTNILVTVDATNEANCPHEQISKLTGLFVRFAIRQSRLISGNIEVPSNLLTSCSDSLFSNKAALDKTTIVNFDNTSLLPIFKASIEDLYETPEFVNWSFDPLDYDCLSLLDPKPESTILDLGCGTGRNAIALENMGHNVFGIDISSSAISSCKKLCKNHRNFSIENVTKTNFESSFFDHAIDVGCLHFLANHKLRINALKEVRRVLKPGGMLLSRCFKPREHNWLKKQLFVAESFGRSSTELLQVFNSVMPSKLVNETSSASYFVSTKETH